MKYDEINKSKSLLLKWKFISEKKEVKLMIVLFVVELEFKNKWVLVKIVVQEIVFIEIESVEFVLIMK